MQNTIEHLHSVFSRFGLPQVIVSDNGTYLTSYELRTLLDSIIFYHLKTAPYHPSSNGLAERAIQTFKSGMKKQSNSNGAVQTKLSHFVPLYAGTKCHDWCSPCWTDVKMLTTVALRFNFAKYKREHKAEAEMLAWCTLHSSYFQTEWKCICTQFLNSWTPITRGN